MKAPAAMIQPCCCQVIENMIFSSGGMLSKLVLPGALQKAEIDGLEGASFDNATYHRRLKNCQHCGPINRNATILFHASDILPNDIGSTFALLPCIGSSGTAVVASCFAFHLLEHRSDAWRHLEQPPWATPTLHGVSSQKTESTQQWRRRHHVDCCRLSSFKRQLNAGTSGSPSEEAASLFEAIKEHPNDPPAPPRKSHHRFLPHRAAV